jgi:hypothetical protein
MGAGAARRPGGEKGEGSVRRFKEVLTVTGGASQWGCGSGFLSGEPALPRIAALFHEPPP